MVKLRCVSIWEKLLRPRFRLFLSDALPLQLVQHTRHAGGCGSAGGVMLVELMLWKRLAVWQL